MKAMAGVTKPEEMLIRLKQFESTSDDAAAVIGRLFTRINLDATLDQLQEGNYNLPNKDQTFFNAIIKGFTQLRSDYVQIDVDTDTCTEQITEMMQVFR